MGKPEQLTADLLVCLKLAQNKLALVNRVPDKPTIVTQLVRAAAPWRASLPTPRTCAVCDCRGVSRGVTLLAEFARTDHAHRRKAGRSECANARAGG